MRNTTLIVIVVLILVAAGAAYQIFLPADDSLPTTTGAPAGAGAPAPAADAGTAGQTTGEQTSSGQATSGQATSGQTSGGQASGGQATSGQTVTAPQASPAPAGGTAPDGAPAATNDTATASGTASREASQTSTQTGGQAPAQAAATTTLPARPAETAAAPATGPAAGATTGESAAAATGQGVAEGAAALARKTVEAVRDTAGAVAEQVETAVRDVARAVAEPEKPQAPESGGARAPEPSSAAASGTTAAASGQQGAAGTQAAAGAGENRQVARLTPVAPRPPTFDIVRISTDGSAVFAGRAPGNALVRLLDEGAERARTSANARGEWSLVLLDPLPPGERALLLIAVLEDGSELRAESELVVLVPDRPRPAAPAVTAAARDDGGKDTTTAPDDGAAKKPEEAVAVVVPVSPSKPVKVLQGPGSGEAGGLALVSVRYDADRQPVLAGRAGSGHTVRAYLDNGFVGENRADGDGNWQIALPGTVPAGDYRLRLDEVTPEGKVVARRELPFTRVAPAQIRDAGLQPDQATSVVVQPGNSLWRIARRVYGEGLRYVEIYRDNADKIRDPDLIYPGQIFTLPPE